MISIPLESFPKNETTEIAFSRSSYNNETKKCQMSNVCCVEIINVTEIYQYGVFCYHPDNDDDEKIYLLENEPKSSR